MSKEVKVGIIGVVGLVFFYLGSNFLKGIDFFSPVNKYYAVYENVDGLIVANPVIVNGYTVGRVSNIRILQNQENRILVTMDIDEDLIIGNNSKATLSSNDFLGSKAIILSIGDINEPLSDGDTISAEIDGGLSELLEKATPITDNLGITISRLNDILSSLRGSGDMITTLNKVNFENTFNQIDILLTSMNGVFDDLESGEGGTLSLLLSDDSLYNNLNQTAYDLDKLLQHINENPKHFFAPLGKSRKKIERDLKKQKEY